MKNIMTVMWLSCTLLLFVPNAPAQDDGPHLPIPDYDDGTPDSWNDTRLLFRVTLISDDPCITFEDRTVRAFSYMEGNDSCPFPGSMFGAETDVQEKNEKPTDPTSTFEETMGYFAEEVDYYRRERPKRGLPVNCGAKIFEQMQIQDDDGRWFDYEKHELLYYIDENDVCVSRGNRGACLIPNK